MEYEKENEFDHYLDALKALEYILKQDEDYYHYWVLAIQRDIELWKTQHQSHQHQGHYGGMGSFNDIGGGPYLNNIKSIAYRLAGDPNNIASVEKSLGTLGLHLDGRHCQKCGNDEVSKKKIELYIRNHFVRSEILANFKTGTLYELAKKRCKKSLPNLDKEYKRVTDIAENSSISIVIDNGPCPKCKSENFEFKHWILNNSGDNFTPFTLDGSALPDDIRSAFK